MRKTKMRLGLILAAAVSMMASTPALAGQWMQAPNGWWWQDDDGSHPESCWRWLDGNGDGWSESYYFDANGYLLVNTTTPDNYLVNENGAWVSNGIVQTIQTGNPVQAAGNAGTDKQEKKEVKPEYEWKETTEKSVLSSSKVIGKSGLSSFTDKTLYNGENTFWSKGYELRGYERAYVKLDVKNTDDYQWEELEFTVSGTINYSNDLYLYGDEDEVIEHWDLRDPKVRTITVDVTDQDFVTLKLDYGTSDIYIKEVKLIGQKRVKVN